MMRSRISRVALSVLILVPGIVLGQGISFQAEAQSVPRLIDAINSQFKTNYAADKEMESDIVCVAVTDVTLDDLLAKIAEVSAGSWVQRSDGWTLIPSKSLRAAELKTEAEFKEAAFRRQIANYKRNWDRMGINSKVIDQLPLDRIAKQSAWTTEVFAVSPNRQQVKLSRGIVNLMGTQWMRNRRTNFSNNNIVVGPYEDLHIVSRHIGSSISLSIEATDKQGVVLSNTSLTLRDNTSYRRTVTQENVDPQKVIKLSDLQMAMAKLWSVPVRRSSSDGPANIVKSLSIPTALRPAVEKILADSTEIEPLSIFVSPTLTTAALIEGRDLVALLPDNSVNLCTYVLDAKQIDAYAALRYLQGSVVKAKNVGEWLLLTPVLPAQSRTDRMSRETLQLLVNDVQKTGALDPVALTDVMPTSAMTSTDLINGYIGYFDVSVASNASAAFGNQFSTYYALSTMSRQYLLDVLRRKPVSFETLSGSVKKAVTRNIFDRRLSVTFRQPSTQTPGSFVQYGLSADVTVQVARAGGRNQTMVTRSTRLSPPFEVTDLLPLGATELTIEIRPSQSNLIQGRSMSRQLMQRASLNQMASAAANAEYGRTNVRTDGLLVCDEYMQVEQRTWSITYKLANGLTASTRVSWVEPDYKGGWRSIDEFDRPFLNSYNSAYRRAMSQAAQQQNSTRSRSGRSRIPPP